MATEPPVFNIRRDCFQQGKSEGISAIRDQLGGELKDFSLLGKKRKMSPEEEEKFARMAEYADFRRAENERQLEAIKAHWFAYISDPKAKFDMRRQATTMYLGAMDIQNRMWGLYNVPEKAKKSDGRTKINNLSIVMVQELQAMAKGKKPELPTAAGRVIENGQ